MKGEEKEMKKEKRERERDETKRKREGVRVREAWKERKRDQISEWRCSITIYLKLSVCLSVCLFGPTICPSVQQFACLSVSMVGWLYICLFVHMSVLVVWSLSPSSDSSIPEYRHSPDASRFFLPGSCVTPIRFPSFLSQSLNQDRACRSPRWWASQAQRQTDGQSYLHGNQWRRFSWRPWRCFFPLRAFQYTH